MSDSNAAMESMNMDENVSVNLLPCPFCSGSAKFQDLNSSGYIACGNCRARGTEVLAPRSYTDPEQRRAYLIKDSAHWWNRRASLKAGDTQIKHMVDRFLGWRLPENFAPDCGISVKKTFNDHLPTPSRYDPSGTNLFDCNQAEAMVRYMVEGLPASTAPASPPSSVWEEATEETARDFIVEAALQGRPILQFAAERGLRIIRTVHPSLLQEDAKR